MALVELCDQGVVHDETGRDPSALLRAIAFPVNEVLEPSTSATYAQETAHREHFTSINNPGRRRGFGGWGQGTRDKRFHQGDMECLINMAHSPR